MKTLIMKHPERGSVESKIRSGIESVNEFLTVFNETTLPKIGTLQELRNCLQNPVEFIGNLIAQTTGQPFKHKFLIENTTLPNIQETIQAAKSLNLGFAIMAMETAIFQDGRLSITNKQMETHLSKMDYYAETDREKQAFELLNNLKTHLEKLLSMGGASSAEALLRLPMGEFFTGSGNTFQINLNGFNKISRQ